MIDRTQDIDWCLEHWRETFINSDQTLAELWREHIDRLNKEERTLMYVGIFQGRSGGLEKPLKWWIGIGEENMIQL